MISLATVNFHRIAPQPVTFLIADADDGTTLVAYRDASGEVFGLRTVTPGSLHHDSCVASWTRQAALAGLALEDSRAPGGNPAPRWRVVVTGGRAPFVVRLSFGDDIIRSAIMRHGVKANEQAAQWLRAAQAGLVPPVPERDQTARMAAAPLRKPAQVQEHDLSPLPLWSDARHQAELF